jgi:transcriptional regulator with XRE-family HTH domain
MGEQEQRDRFSYALRAAMTRRKASGRALAAALRIDARHIAKWRRGESLPNLYESQALAAALRVREALFKEPPEVPVMPPVPHYPLDEYLLEAADSGAVEGHHRATTPPPTSIPGRHPHTPGRRVRASGA